MGGFLDWTRMVWVVFKDHRYRIFVIILVISLCLFILFMAGIFDFVFKVQEFFKDYRYIILTVIFGLYSYFLIYFGGHRARWRLRLRLMGTESLLDILSPKAWALHTAPAKNIVLVLATSMSNKEGTKHATGHGQLRGAFELAHAITQAYGRIDPNAIRLSLDEHATANLEDNDVFLIGGLEGNDILMKRFKRVNILLQKKTGHTIELGKNVIALNCEGKPHRIFKPEPPEGNPDFVYGIVARIDSNHKKRRRIIAAGTRTQGTLAACQYLSRHLNVCDSIDNKHFVAIIKASVSGNGIGNDIKVIYFEGLSDDRRLCFWRRKRSECASA